MTGGAAADAGIDDGFRSANLNIAAGLKELLSLFHRDIGQRLERFPDDADTPDTTTA